MGVENNEAVLATTWCDTSMAKATEWINLQDEKHKSLFTIIEGLTNNKKTVILAPDGSKKGWALSNEIRGLRDGFIEFLENDELIFNWVEVGYGEYGQKVLRGNNTNCYTDDAYAV